MAPYNKYEPDKIVLKEFAFQLFEIGQTVGMIKRKVKAWLNMSISLGPFQLLNHGHARKEIEDYLDYRWLPAPVHRHDPKVLIVSHFQRLVMATQYRHEVHLDDSFFEDTKKFEEALARKKAWHIP